MGLLTSLFGRWSGTDAEPWTEQSAYRAIRSQIDTDTGRLAAGARLPDEAALDDNTIRWAPGALDGVLGHHTSLESDKATAARLGKLIDDISRKGDRKAIVAAYAMMKDESMLGLLDSVIEHLSDRKSPLEPHLEAFALRLAKDAADRGAVKVGIALLGVMRLSQHREIVETLGLHDEFTLYAAVALRNLLPDPEIALWQLASKVDGWGRIQIVERLPPIGDPSVRHWLRTEGFRNSVMYEYLALTAAEHGKLRDALDTPTVSAGELIAASEIIEAMINADGGPCAGMNFYTDAAATCLLYLGHVDKAPFDLRHYATVHSVLGYLARDDRPSDQRLALGWSETAIAAANRVGGAILARETWGTLIREQLASTDDEMFYRAAAVAVSAQIDPFPWHWERVQAKPDDPGAWHRVMRHANPDRIDAILELAERQLPLDELATGPADKTGLGPEFTLHSCLDFILQDLKPFPGKGSRLIACGLMSPVVRNRHMAINAIEAWDRAHWTDEMRQAIAGAHKLEVVDDVSKRLAALAS